MSVNLDNVKDRIRRLLAIAADGSGATEQEIETAMRFAQSELAKHQLSEADLSEEPEVQYQRAENAPKDCAASPIGRKCYYWESALANAIGELVGVPHYLDHPHPRHDRNGVIRRDRNGKPLTYAKAFVWYGIAEDAWLAAELYDELRETILTMALMRWGGAYRGDGGMYCEGFVSGLRENIRKQREAERGEAQERLTQRNDSRGLVLIERRSDLVAHNIAVAKDWLKEEQGINLVSGSKRGGATGSGAAFRSGQSDGRKARVSAARNPKLA